MHVVPVRLATLAGLVALALALGAAGAIQVPVYSDERSRDFVLGADELAPGVRAGELDPALVERRRARAAVFDSRLSAASASGTFPIPLYGSTLSTSTYYAHVELGTPPQTNVLITDTGSSDMAVFTTGCYGCPSQPASAWFNPAFSTSYQLLSCTAPGVICQACYDGQCLFEDSYGDQSYWLGSVATDVFALANGSLSATVQFGAISKAGNQISSGYFSTGIWGLAFGRLSAWNGEPAFLQLVANGELAAVFSMCLLSPAGSGSMTLGRPAVDESLFQFTPIVTDSYYVVNLTNISSAGVAVGATALTSINFTIVDSGTTLAVFPTPVLDAIHSIWADGCAHSHLVGICGVESGHSLFDGLCFEMSTAQIAAFPAIELAMANVTDGYLRIAASSYLLPQTSAGVTYQCLGIGGLDGQPIVILGDVFMQNYHVMFDIENQRVGFGPTSSCPSVPHPPYVPVGPSGGPPSSPPARVDKTLLTIILAGCGAVLLGVLLLVVVLFRRRRAAYAPLN